MALEEEFGGDVEAAAESERGRNVGRLMVGRGRGKVFLQVFPALTGWANVWRAYGASNRGKDGLTEAEVRSGRGKPRRYTNAGLSGRGRTAKTAKDPPLQTAEEGHDVSCPYMGKC